VLNLPLLCAISGAVKCVQLSVVKGERVEMSAVSTIKDEHDEINAVILWWRNAAQRVCAVETVEFPHVRG